MENKPNFIEYFDTENLDKSMDQDWDQYLDKTWIHSLRLKFPEYNYSLNYKDENFPPYAFWSAEFIQAYNNEIKKAQDRLKEKALGAEMVYQAEDFTVYAICGENEESFIDYLYMGWRTFSKIVPHEDDGAKYEFDSIQTAVYAFINDHKDWESKWGEQYRLKEKKREYELLAQLGAPREDIYSSVGGNEECDFCASYGLIVKEIDGNSCCKNCFEKMKS